MSPFGIGLRVLLVSAWIALIGWHGVRYAYPDLGLARTFDPSEIMRVNLDRAFRYEVRRSLGGKPFAECLLTLTQDDARYRSTTSVHVRDLGSIQGLGTVLSLLGVRAAKQPPGLSASLTQILDARFRLVEAEATGEGFGTTFAAKGTVDSRGLHGRYRIGDGPWTPVEMPSVSQDLAQGSDLALTLPPRLKPGDAFSARMMHVDAVQMNARPVVGVFTVQEAETITVAKRPVACVKVALAVENRPTALMWADSDGVVFRLIQQGTGMVMELAAITATTGGAIWPAPAAPPGPATPVTTP